MATRMLDWTVKESILTMAEYKGKDESAIELETFDLSLIYPDFAEMNQVQKFLIEYGAKQKLADSGSSNIGDIAGKVKVAQAKWKQWLNGELTGVRLNATGAKENKRLANAVRDTAKVISLEGLIIKKTQFPDTFTKEDQKKLTEFFQIMKDNG